MTDQIKCCFFWDCLNSFHELNSYEIPTLCENNLKESVDYLARSLGVAIFYWFEKIVRLICMVCEVLHFGCYSSLKISGDLYFFVCKCLYFIPCLISSSLLISILFACSFCCCFMPHRQDKLGQPFCWCILCEDFNVIYKEWLNYILWQKYQDYLKLLPLLIEITDFMSTNKENLQVAPHALVIHNRMSK